jgi:hypothetical protein
MGGTEDGEDGTRYLIREYGVWVVQACANGKPSEAGGSQGEAGPTLPPVAAVWSFAVAIPLSIQESAAIHLARSPGLPPVFGFVTCCPLLDASLWREFRPVFARLVLTFSPGNTSSPG